MAAYSAVTSLKHTIDRLLNSSRVSVASSTRQILDFACEHVERLQHTLEEFDKIKNSSEGVMAVDARIRVEARKLEDAIDTHASTQLLSQSQSHEGCPPMLSINLDVLRQDIDCFAERATMIGLEYIEELHKPSSEMEDAADNGGDDCDCDMVGLSDQFLIIRDKLSEGPSIGHVLSISGMAGIGKTMLANKVFHDSLIKENFECRAFVRIGRKYQVEEVLRAILAQVNLDNDRGGDEDLRDYFKRSFMARKHLIVFDDIWDGDFSFQFETLLPDPRNGSWIVKISRDSKTAESFSNYFDRHLMRFMNQDESWDLLKREVFGEEECPYPLVKPGKKIAENCEGLPLLILSIAQILSKAQKNSKYWEEVAEKQNSVFEDACDQISEVLLPSYHYLIQNFKACFLYFGAFPHKYIVRRSEMVNLWRAEGFLRLVFFMGTSKKSVASTFDHFVSSNLVVVRQRSSNTDRYKKACSLHIAYRYICRKEADNNKFLHILNSCVDGSIEQIKGHRYLAIYNNVLFAVKDVHDAMASVSTVRSLLCTGPHHQYQVPICLEYWRLLRVLNVLTIRFYEFPIEVVKLIHLRYLALACNANLPPSISQLFNLRWLIFRQYLSIKCAAAESYVPVEIWEMQELKYLQIMGRNLPDPPPGSQLPNLANLLDVGIQSCTHGILGSIPNLKKIRIQIELTPDAGQFLSCFDPISFLRKLKSFQSVITNSRLLREPTVQPPPLSIVISDLEKLTLSGFGYPWESMSIIAQLPSLSALKLKCYAFRGESWEVPKHGFWYLRYLFIEDTDLVQWTVGHATFQNLGHLTLKNCHKLQEIPTLISLREVELVDCHPLAEVCAKKMVGVDVKANYSWK